MSALRNLLVVALALAFARPLLQAEAAPPSLGSTVTGSELEKFTGAHTRVVWVVDDQNKDTFAEHVSLRLVGLDSRDGKGARYILSEPSNYHLPLITPDGKRVIFTNRRENRIFVVNWDGTDLHFLHEGAASDVWRDPESGKVWVFAQLDCRNRNSPYVRFLLDHPEKMEVVWDSTPVHAAGGDGLQVSHDGRRAAGAFPWPNSGVAELPNITWRKHRDGCWPSMAPDNSYMSWTFDGPHRNLFMTRPGSEKNWTIPVSTAPGVNNFEVFHPRWSNDVRFMVMSGPYTTGEKKVKLWDGADGVELHAGRFNREYTAVESWLKLTDSRVGEFFPDLWIEGGEKAVSIYNQSHPASSEKESLLSRLAALFKFTGRTPATWPGSRDGLVFLWEDNKSANDFVNALGKKRSVRLTAQGGARWGPHNEMHIVRGGFVPSEGISSDIRKACLATNELAVEAVITSSLPEQFGPARIISLSMNTKYRNFTLGQEGNRLVLRLRTSRTNGNGIDILFTELPAREAHHVLVTYKPGRLVCYVDGRVVKETNFETGTLQEWGKYDLIFGQEHENMRRWEGFLEHVAIYSRFIGPAEALAKSQLSRKELADRKAIPSMPVRAEMLTKDEPPPSEAIAPYRRALVINRYKIFEARDANLVGKTVQVAEWAMLDAVPPPGYQSSQVGTVRNLELQPYESHPQLESERLASDPPSLDEDVYYNVISGRE